jgi:energy-coupling factor transporter ATP-binding protein EcfA2
MKLAANDRERTPKEREASGVAILRDYGVPDERIQATVNQVRRERLIAKDINIGGAISLADQMPDTSWVMRPALVDAQLITITGQNGSGKSTFIAAIAFSLALNRALGVLRPERRGLVYIVCAEDIAGWRLRIYAEAVRHNLSTEERAELDNWLRWVHINSAVHPATIRDHISQDAAGNDVCAIFLDTGPALFAGDDENSNTELQQFASSCRLLTEVPGAPCVGVLWHPAKSATADNLIPRGGSSLIGTVDANLTLWREDEGFTLAYTKLRSEHFEPMRFEFERIPLVLPSGANATVPVATPLADESVEHLDATTRKRREAILLTLASADADDGLGVREIATRTGLPRSTVGRDLKDLSTPGRALVSKALLGDGRVLNAMGKRAVQEFRARDAKAYRNASNPD